MSANATRVQKTMTSVAAMQEFAAVAAEALRPGDTVLLYGELGAGKTTFVQGVARVLGVAGAVTSPTFTIVSDYTTRHPSIARLIHVDLYRLAPDAAKDDPAVRDLLAGDNNADAVIFVEWADRVTWSARGRVWSLKFAHGQDVHERSVTLERELVDPAS